ncbi:uncharacterized protein LAJ45_08752 [Morchella importuna]|uniref:uncharacterized protein n=1 Tax=Morchella importuna TaxID=1174673 RepID=UPI001E8E5377|nr:uncharacterized protein LAJ45_08752 [Morchella importuna]KAH8147274.1 hypothetical protein LAJ45_08752 [Morchella importuna]
MFSHAARHLLLRRAPAVKLKIPTTRAHSTFNHRAFVGRGMYTRHFPEPVGEGGVGAYVLDTRAGIGELLYQVEILKTRQESHGIMLWMSVTSNIVFATAFAYIAFLDDDEVDPLVKEVKRKRKEK